ncbi:branched-chain amino acid ABC transporter substrate-binding protein [Bauldia litoralis]|uniref:branched-chain amino acid ABC transporter substrate-binding protein n=1 Tax=Bauldia litoralis TaxID=665467 RepID=UPI0032648FD0
MNRPDPDNGCAQPVTLFQISKEQLMRKLLKYGIALSFGAAFASAAHADVTVAVVGPMTGPYAAYGEQMKTGADQWAADINKAGGLLGQKVVVDARDDGCDPEKAVTVAGELATEKVAIVIGHFCSGASIPASRVYATENIVQISPASTNPKFTDERPGVGVMRVAGRDDQQGQIAGEFLAWRFRDQNVAVIDDGSAYGKGLADETRRFMNEAGKTEVLSATFENGQTDFSELVSKLKTANADAVYVGGYFPEAALIVKAMREQGMKTVLVSGDTFAADAYWDAAGDAAEGTLFTFSPDPRRGPDASSVVAEFKAGGVDPEGYVLFAYGALQAWAQAVDNADTVEFGPVVDALQKGTFRSVLGDFHFDDKGDVNLPSFVIYEWKDGSYDYYVASR